MEYINFPNVVPRVDVKKILFALPNLNGGGAERVIVNIIRLLDNGDYEIKLLLLDNSGDYFQCIPEDVEIITLGVRKTRYALHKLINTVNRISPDIIFATLNRMNILVLLASLFVDIDVKVIVREPNLPSAQINNKCLRFWQIFLIKRLYPIAYRVIAQTDEMREEIHKLFMIKKDKIITLMNPIDTHLIDENLKNVSSPFDGQYKNFVAIGRLNYQKGFDILIEAFAKVVQKDKQHRLYILGEGEERQKLENQISNNGLSDNIYLLGFQTNPYIYIKYARAVILSSRWEGLPNVLLESLYIQTPIIATRVIDLIQSLIVNGENGYITELNSDSLSNSIRDLDKLKLKFNSSIDHRFNFKKNFSEII